VTAVSSAAALLAARGGDRRLHRWDRSSGASVQTIDYLSQRHRRDERQPAPRHVAESPGHGVKDHEPRRQAWTTRFTEPASSARDIQRVENRYRRGADRRRELVAERRVFASADGRPPSCGYSRSRYGCVKWFCRVLCSHRLESRLPHHCRLSSASCLQERRQFSRCGGMKRQCLVTP